MSKTTSKADTFIPTDGVLTSTSIPGDTSTTAVLLADGPAVFENMDFSGDNDWFRFNVATGASYDVTAVGFDNGMGVATDFEVLIWDPAGISGISSGGAGSGPFTVNEVPSESNTYFAAVENGFFGGGPGGYMLSATASDDFADDIFDGAHPRGSLVVGGTSSGILETIYDYDLFEVSLIENHTYVFEMTGLDGGGGDLPDPLLRLLAPNGEFISLNDDATDGLFDSTIGFTARETGIFFLSAQAYESTDPIDRIGTYTLSSTDLGIFSDIGESAEFSNAALNFHIAMDTDAPSPLAGEINFAGDHDWYSVDLVAGETYTFVMSGTAAGGTLDNPDMELFDALGNFIDSAVGFGADAQLVFTALETGTYFLDVTDNLGETGTFTLITTVTDDFADNLADMSLPMGAITVGGPASYGVLQSSSDDMDIFSASLTAGVTYSVRVDGSTSSTSTLFDPSIAVYNMSQSQFFFDDDGGAGLSSFLTFTPTTSETFFFEVANVFTPGGSYLISVHEYPGTTLTGNNGPNTIIGGNGDEEILGLDGKDSLNGRGGDDVVIGGDDADTVRGQDGDDTVYGGERADIVRGDNDNDLLFGDAAADDVGGGAGDDTMFGGDGIDIYKGGTGNDLLIGDDDLDFDRLRGEAGNDTIRSDLGDDKIRGGSGDDLISSGSGVDDIVGEDGNDTIDGGRGDDSILGGDDNDLIFGGDGEDRIQGDKGDDTVYGGNDFDRLIGKAGNDALFSEGGDDRISAGIGNDTLDGGTGNDFLRGGGDDDRLVGGTGDDTSEGGEGDDTFVYQENGNVDRITDFNDKGTDQIEFLDMRQDFDSAAEVLAAAVQDGSDVLIDFGGGDRLIIEDLALGDFDATDFYFAFG